MITKPVVSLVTMYQCLRIVCDQRFINDECKMGGNTRGVCGRVYDCPVIQLASLEIINGSEVVHGKEKA